jgi:hypothetical protein
MPISLTPAMRDYAKTMHGPAYRAFLSWCRQPKSRAANRLVRVLEDYAPSDRASHAAASALRQYLANGETYEVARYMVIRAIVIRDLIA